MTLVKSSPLSKFHFIYLFMYFLDYFIEGPGRGRNMGVGMEKPPPPSKNCVRFQKFPHIFRLTRGSYGKGFLSQLGNKGVGSKMAGEIFGIMGEREREKESKKGTHFWGV